MCPLFVLWSYDNLAYIMQVTSRRNNNIRCTDSITAINLSSRTTTSI